MLILTISVGQMFNYYKIVINFIYIFCVWIGYLMIDCPKKKRVFVGRKDKYRQMHKIVVNNKIVSLSFRQKLSFNLTIIWTYLNIA